MNLYEKIVSIYPELATQVDENGVVVEGAFSLGVIVLQNDSDGRGDYIAKWEHPTLPRPTEEQLA